MTSHPSHTNEEGPTPSSQLDEILQERQRWMEFERRDGWYAGFILGMLIGAAIVAVGCAITWGFIG
jgi:hypothetical protein